MSNNFLQSNLTFFKCKCSLLDRDCFAFIWLTNDYFILSYQMHINFAQGSFMFKKPVGLQGSRIRKYISAKCRHATLRISSGHAGPHAFAKESL